jgi:hypothetical protein
MKKFGTPVGVAPGNENDDVLEEEEPALADEDDDDDFDFDFDFDLVFVVDVEVDVDLDDEDDRVVVDDFEWLDVVREDVVVELEVVVV